MTDYTDQAPPRREYGDVPEPTGGDKSIGEALGDVTRDLSVLVQQELAFVARVSPNRAGYPKRHVGVQLARSFACAVMEQRWPCSGTDG
jgi:hypothetical protein